MEELEGPPGVEKVSREEPTKFIPVTMPESRNGTHCHLKLQHILILHYNNHELIRTLIALHNKIIYVIT
jgi:hypothetical protein